MRKIPFAGIELTSQRVRGYMVPLSYRGDLQVQQIIHRNRKRFFLVQSSLREEFVEKKYQVFDIVRPLIILVE